MPDNDDFSDDVGFEEDFDEVDAVDDDDLGEASASSQPDEADFHPGAEEDLDDDLSDLQIDGAVSTDDPVRMYLKEIGQVPLLDGNREVWLSTQLAANHMLQEFIDKLSSPDKKGKDGKGLPEPHEVVELAYSSTLQNWGEILKRSAKLKVEPPEALKVIEEVQAINSGADPEGKSYVRAYLRQREWGRDEPWTEFAAFLFGYMQGFYFVPAKQFVALKKAVTERGILQYHCLLYTSLTP